jgi:exonuclease SbcD
MLVGYLTADWHLHFWEKYNPDGRRLKTQLEFIRNLFKRAQASKAPIIFGGDLFHTPEGLKSPTVNLVYPYLISLFLEFPDVQFYAVSGNHDQYTRNYLHNPSVSYIGGLANAIKNFHTIDMMGVDLGNGVGLYGIPYLYLDTGIALAIAEARKWFKDNKIKKSILLLHTTFAGAEDTNGYSDSGSELGYKYFNEAFDLVISGHIHKFQKTSKGMFHIGSPFHTRVSDMGYDPVFETLTYKHGKFHLHPKDVVPVMKFRQYQDISEKDKDPLTMWAPATVASRDSENRHKTEADISDLQGLLKAYLTSIGVKSPRRFNYAKDILKEVINDNVQGD